VELLIDEDLMVRLEALDAVIGVMPTKVSAEQVDRDILPAFIRHLDIDHDDECN